MDNSSYDNSKGLKNSRIFYQQYMEHWENTKSSFSLLVTSYKRGIF